MSLIARYFLLYMLTVMCPVALWAADTPPEPLQYTNHIYRPFIKTVTTHAANNALTYPIVPLQGGMISIGFDDLRPNPVYYNYQLIYCNANWQAVENLSTFDYLNGFSQDQITDFSFSTGTQIPYIHYQLNIPNSNMQPKKSGNYLLVVYEDQWQQPVLTRRLMFYENIAQIEAQWYSAMGMQSNTHQRLSCKVDFSDKDYNNPMEQIKLCVLQNGRWDNAQLNVPPTFWDFQSLRYDSPNILQFEAGNDFRFVDNRLTIPFRRNKKQLLPPSEDRDTSSANILQKNDALRSRSEQRFRVSNSDYNGKFVIGNSRGLFRWSDADYTLVRFRLDAPQLPDSAKVYLHGALTDWEISPAFALTYNPDSKFFEMLLYLKQGIHDYQYLAYIPNQLDLSPHQITEGNFVTTENDYLILVYYRTFTQAYDRLVGYRLLNTFR